MNRIMLENIYEQKPTQTNQEILSRLAEYCKYLYEEEKGRTERLEKKVNIFSVALGGSFVAVFLKLPVGRMSAFINFSQPNAFIATVLLFVSLLLFIMSSFFTFLVYKVRKFERLSDPKQMAAKAQAMTDEVEMLSAIIADYTVATNKNHDINDAKARHLSYALLCLVSALLLIVVSLVLFNIALP